MSPCQRPGDGREEDQDLPNEARRFESFVYQKLEENLAEMRANAATDPNAGFASTQMFGTPEQCIERIQEIQRTVGADHFVGVLRYGAMPIEKAEASPSGRDGSQ
jgi:alkanesulfonate monooxygenase SsuD/methylene tetrahydromethanopterin reductase-like flavin-dependent oxidoreductase (luciferase family)